MRSKIPQQVLRSMRLNQKRYTKHPHQQPSNRHKLQGRAADVRRVCQDGAPCLSQTPGLSREQAPCDRSLKEVLSIARHVFWTHRAVKRLACGKLRLVRFNQGACNTANVSVCVRVRVRVCIVTGWLICPLQLCSAQVRVVLFVTPAVGPQ